jgi:hypothetical protein
MKDCDIRGALWAHLDALHASDPDAVLLDELGVCEGRCRVDLAVVGDSLSGFEIKSDQDTLARLEEQQRLYSKVFDYVTIVAHGAHLARVIERVPDWWGVTQAIGIGSTSVAFIERRPAQKNPKPDPLAIAQLLWREEVIAVLERRGIDRGVRTKPRRQAWKRAASAIPLPELAAEVRDALKRRSWRPLAPVRRADRSGSDSRPVDAGRTARRL